MRQRQKWWRGVALLAAAGVVLQTGSCALDAEALVFSLLDALVQALLASLTGTTTP